MPETEPGFENEVLHAYEQERQSQAARIEEQPVSKRLPCGHPHDCMSRGIETRVCLWCVDRDIIRDLNRDNLAIKAQRLELQDRIAALEAENARIREHARCAKCGLLPNPEKVQGQHCDECWSELEAEVARLRALTDDMATFVLDAIYGERAVTATEVYCRYSGQTVEAFNAQREATRQGLEEISPIIEEIFGTECDKLLEDRQ